MQCSAKSLIRDFSSLILVSSKCCLSGAKFWTVVLNACAAACAHGGHMTSSYWHYKKNHTMMMTSNSWERNMQLRWRYVRAWWVNRWVAMFALFVSLQIFNYAIMLIMSSWVAFVYVVNTSTCSYMKRRLNGYIQNDYFRQVLQPRCSAHSRNTVV